LASSATTLSRAKIGAVCGTGPIIFARKQCKPYIGARPAVATLSMVLAEKLERLPKSQVALTIDVSADETSKYFDKVIKDIAQQANIPGFRKGKVPRHVLLSHFGTNKIYGTVCEELFNEFVGKALKEMELKYVGQASIEGEIDQLIESFHPGKPFSFKIKIDVWPEAKFSGDYKGFQVQAEQEPFDESLVDKALEEIRKKNSTLVAAKAGTPADMDMAIVATMKGFYRNEDGSKGEALPQIADGDNVDITMEKGVYMEGFVEGLVGAKAGETRLVPVTFPANASRSELRNVKAIFEVEVKEVKERVIPELNDDFAKSVSEDQTMEAFRNNVRQRLNTESADLNDRYVKKAIEDKLVEMTEVEIPETLVQERTKNKFAQMMADFKSQGLDDAQVRSMITPENYDKYAKNARKNVERSLILSFAFEKLVSMEDIKPTQQEIDDQVMLAKSELKGDDIDEAKLLELVEAEIARDKALEFLKTHAKVTYVPKKQAE